MYTFKRCNEVESKYTSSPTILLSFL